jgi:hypothetical protein
MAAEIARSGALVAVEAARAEWPTMTPSELVHRLNNDLTVARGCLELLRESDLPPAVEPLATQALAAMERAVALLQQYQHEADPPAVGE